MREDNISGKEFPESEGLILEKYHYFTPLPAECGI
jgi:hypothetical protein